MRMFLLPWSMIQLYALVCNLDSPLEKLLETFKRMKDLRRFNLSYFRFSIQWLLKNATRGRDSLLLTLFQRKLGELHFIGTKERIILKEGKNYFGDYFGNRKELDQVFNTKDDHTI